MKIALSIIVSFVFISFTGYGQAASKNKIPDFLKIPKDAVVRYSFGALQATEHAADSAGYIGMADVYDEQRTYEVLFLYKDVASRKSMGYDALEKIFFENELDKDAYTGFSCYAFVYPQHNPDQQEDAHGITIDFPVTVAAYKQAGKNSWVYAGKTTAATLAAFSAFQFGVVYGYIDEQGKRN